MNKVERSYRPYNHFCMSVEKRLYLKEITEACIGSDEARRINALLRLASDDPIVRELLPGICKFIGHGVRLHVIRKNLTLLIYLMRMVKALLDNKSLFLQKYLHELIPAVTTCVVSKQLCVRIEYENHWALRDFASQLMAQICKNFDSNSNNIQNRITSMLQNALNQDKMPLSSLYGVLRGLSELGPEVVRIFILPRVKMIGSRLEDHSEKSMSSNVDKQAAAHIKKLMVKTLLPVLKVNRSSPDVLEEYKQDYGYLGPLLHSGVSKDRTQPVPATITCSSVTNTATTSIASTVATPGSAANTPIVQQNPELECGSQEANG